MLQWTLRPLRRPCINAYSLRGYASSTSDSANAKAKLDSKAFAKTLQLPTTPFPLWANAKEVEDKFRQLTCDQLYRWQVGWARRFFDMDTDSA